MCYFNAIGNPPKDKTFGYPERNLLILHVSLFDYLSFYLVPFGVLYIYYRITIKVEN